MTSFDWSVLTAGLAGGLGMGLIATAALHRRRTRPPGKQAQIGPESPPRRIEVVAITEAKSESQSSTIERR